MNNTNSKGLQELIQQHFSDLCKADKDPAPAEESEEESEEGEPAA
jgi:hypothetical protein